jgi:hypothetical protein
MRSIPAVNERTEHEIAALRLQLRAELQRTGRLLSALVRALLRAHLSPPTRVVTTSPVGIPMPRGGGQQPSRDDDSPTSDQGMCIVEVDVVVRRVTWQDGDTWHDGDGHPAAERLQDAFDEYVAKNTIDAAWNPSTEFWITPDYDGAASFAEGLSDVQHQWHYLALGKPVESAGYQMNLEAASVEVFAGIAAEFALPGDTSIKNIKRIVQFTCIAVGVASGQPLLANAGFKSLLHDFVIEAAAKALKHTFTNTAESDVGTDVCQRIEESFAQLEMKCEQLEGFAFVDEQDWKRDLAQIKRDFAQIKENLALVKAPERIEQLERRWAALGERIEQLEQWRTALEETQATVENAAWGQSCRWADYEDRSWAYSSADDDSAVESDVDCSGGS